MAAKTAAKWLQEALLGILQDGVASLAVDGRAVRVTDLLPDDGMTQRQFPAVVVLRPSVSDREAWGRDYERVTYGVTLMALDVMGPTARDLDEVMERAELLAANVRVVIEAEESDANLRLAFLHVFRSLVDWSIGQAEHMGNNVVGVPMELSVGMTIERGKVWSDEATVLVLGTEDGLAITTEDGLALAVG